MLLWSALQWKSSDEAIHSFADAAAGHSPPIRGQLQLFNHLETDTTRTPEYVRDAFQTCDSYAQVMGSLKVSRHDVVRWLETDPELRVEWKARLREGKLLDCIERIKSCVKNAPQTGLPDIEKVARQNSVGCATMRPTNSQRCSNQSPTVALRRLSLSIEPSCFLALTVPYRPSKHRR
jgi:hypothetical protein